MSEADGHLCSACGICTYEHPGEGGCAIHEPVADIWLRLAETLQVLEARGEDPSLEYDRVQGRSGSVYWDGLAWVREEQR